MEDDGGGGDDRRWRDEKMGTGYLGRGGLGLSAQERRGVSCGGAWAGGQMPEMEVKDSIVARKVQKADREKLRRDRLNEHFLELGKTLDPDRPKNDKATILTDTVQMLKDLNAELTQEKNELREEKATLKSDIDNLNIQHQQRLGVMFPWTAIDPSVVMGSPYSFPVPVPVRPAPIPIHPSLQPFPFFGNQNSGAIPNPCSNFIPYPNPANPQIERPSAQYASTSHISSKKDSRSKSSEEHQRGSIAEKCDDSNDVATELELKMPGSAAQQDLSSGERKGKQPLRKEKSVTDGCCSSRYSSQGFQDSSSNSIGDATKPDK
nr:basic helix-loop-helix transcription factor [Loropetalum chinense var. rubrum]